MGFGKSETPQDREYFVEDHYDNLDALLLSLDMQNVTLVLQGWGGPIGTNFAFRHPERIKRLFYIDPIPRVGIPSGINMAVLAKEGNTPWAQFFTSLEFDAVMSHLGRSILSVLKRVGFVNHQVISGRLV
jgi:pimeloyl-ACP methyl ester carboxylesterase